MLLWCGLMARTRLWLLASGSVAVALGIAALTWLAGGHSAPGDAGRPDATPAIPATPLVRRAPEDSGVRTIGGLTVVSATAACEGCHPAVATAYQRSGMARSLALVGDALGPGVATDIENQLVGHKVVDKRSGASYEIIPPARARRPRSTRSSSRSRGRPICARSVTSLASSRSNGRGGRSRTSSRGWSWRR